MRRYLLAVLLLFSVLLLFFACRRTELQPHVQNEIIQQNDQYGRFFNVPASSSAEAKAIAAAVKKQNEKFNFLFSVIKSAGYPVWDKAKVINYNNGTISAKQSSDPVTGEVVYVPFVLDSGNTTNAVMAVRLNDPDTTYRLLYARNYRRFGYDTTNHTKWNARNVFNLFSTFDYTVFGHTKFLIKDDSLFKPRTDSSHVVLTLKNYLGQNVAGRTSSMAEDCTEYTECEFYDDGGGGGSGGGGMARTNDIYVNCVGYTICNGGGGGGSGDPTGGGDTGGGWTGTGDGTGNPYNLGNGGGGNPNNPSSGGGGGGGWYDGSGNPNPCPTNGPFKTQRVAPNDCGPGWMPAPENADFNLPFPGDNQDFIAENIFATDCNSFEFVNTTPLWKEAGVKNVNLRVYYFDYNQVKQTVNITLNQIVIGFGQRWTISQAKNMAAKAIDLARDDTFEHFRTKDYADPATVEQYFRDKINEIVRLKGGTASRVGSGSANIVFHEAQATGFFSTPYDC